MITYSERRETCPHIVTPESERRPANALNIEIGSPALRCTLKPPAHWRGVPSTLRWLGSGGSPLVLGECNQNCPGEREEEVALLQEQLDAARRKYTADEKEIGSLKQQLFEALRPAGRLP